MEKTVPQDEADASQTKKPPQTGKAPVGGLLVGKWCAP
jgi:hypothetical protein